MKLLAKVFVSIALLPSLLLTFEKKIANKKVFKEPKLKILPPKEEKVQ